ncbi:UPF0139 membrane protein [Heterostelium album PN500]|uniref:UPF0139 membrane protein n=1 Tax=Heterostelium pallidum (strain ATCC 26659 / Pp 5 / PN500) TaxID=670386 RepID=D3AXD0_HETP5|nr:UPF0139 membrane protein [Heterostelium album PN500]EFA86199.1 UPF0139 membrane protein [Heterostelium album PN500]|eukprot:XP_020438304.1 UPF0139 membrane protein [Heterostelium album PN500]
MNKGDPRRPATAIFEMRPPLSQQEKDAQNLDYWSMLCFAFAFIGIFARYKIALWISVVCCIASLANMKSADGGLRAMTSSVSMSFLGLAMAYFSPNSHLYN